MRPCASPRASCRPPPAGRPPARATTAVAKAQRQVVQRQPDRSARPTTRSACSSALRLRSELAATAQYSATIADAQGWLDRRPTTRSATINDVAPARPRARRPGRQRHDEPEGPQRARRRDRPAHRDRQGARRTRPTAARYVFAGQDDRHAAVRPRRRRHLRRRHRRRSSARSAPASPCRSTPPARRPRQRQPTARLLAGPARHRRAPARRHRGRHERAAHDRPRGARRQHGRRQLRARRGRRAHEPPRRRPRNRLADLRGLHREGCARTIEDVDIAEAISQLSTQQSVYQAALQARAPASSSRRSWTSSVADESVRRSSSTANADICTDGHRLPHPWRIRGRSDPPVHRFGELEVPAEAVIEFPNGLIGLGGTRYALLARSEDSAFVWLHSIDDPALAIPRHQPVAFFADYDVELSDERGRAHRHRRRRRRRRST